MKYGHHEVMNSGSSCNFSCDSFCQTWPSRLAIILDPYESLEGKLQVAKEFLATDLCCLDDLVSRRLRTIMQVWPAVMPSTKYKIQFCNLQSHSMIIQNWLLLNFQAGGYTAEDLVPPDENCRGELFDVVT